MKFKLTDKKIILIAFILVIIVLAAPFVLRLIQGNMTLMGDYAYHHLRLSENQSLLLQSKFFTPYDLILFSLNKIIPSETWSMIVPILLGIGTILLFNNFLRKFELIREQKFFILIFLILSPAFIYFFTFSNQYGLVVFLLILSVNIVEIKNNLKYLAVPLVLLLGFFDVLTTMLVLGLLTAYWLLKKDQQVLYLASGFFLSTVLIQIFYPQPFIYELWQPINFFSEFFSDLGALKGINFFYLLLSTIGLIVTWKKRRIYYFIYPAIFLLILLFAFVNANVVIYLNFILAFYSGLGLMWLWQRKWKLNFLKKLSILLLLIALLLSTMNYLNQISQVQPNNFVKESLEWIKDNSYPGTIVLSHQSKSFWIQSIAERQPFLDIYSDDYKNRLILAETIFYSRDLKLSSELMEENNIKYIWIDTEMLRGQVWSDNDEGLLFLFRNPRFKNVYAQKGIEIWRFD